MPPLPPFRLYNALNLRPLSLPVRIINRSDNPLPAYETAGSAGLDLRAFLAEPVTLPPLGRALIPTGLFLELPQGYEAQVRPRSGLALRQAATPFAVR